MRQVKLNRGSTLVEAMVAILVLGIMVIGTSGYRYYAELDARKSVKNATAARIALLLNEGWRGQDANSTYNPYNQLNNAFAALGSSRPTIAAITSGAPTQPAGFTKLGSYKVTAGNATYFITMSCKDEETKTATTTPSWTGNKKTAINTIAAWPVTASETTYSAQNYWSFNLTTYVEKVNW